MPWRGVSATCSCSATFFRRVLTRSCRHALHFSVTEKYFHESLTVPPIAVKASCTRSSYRRRVYANQMVQKNSCEAYFHVYLTAAQPYTVPQTNTKSHA